MRMHGVSSDGEPCAAGGLRCAETGKVIAENEITSFNRGAGGFGKRPHVQRKAAAIARNAPPE